MGEESSTRARLPFGASAASVFGVALVVALATWLTHLQMSYTPLLREERSNLERSIDGTADRPFCYRVLVPQVTAMVGHLVPRSLGDRVCSEPASWSVCRYMPPASEKRAPYFALAAILFSSLLAYALVLGRTYRRLFQAPAQATWFAAAGSLLLVVLVVVFGYCGHIYDFTMLALFAGMLSALLFDRLPLFLGLFALSCWAKETTVLMTFAFAAIYWGRISTRRFFLYLAAQVAAFLAAYGTVRLLFGHNPGGDVEHWYAHELEWLGRKTLPKVLLIASTAFAVAFGWRDKPLSLRRSSLMVAPHLALFIYGARPGELRNLYESFPVLTLFLLRNSAIVSGKIVSQVRAQIGSRGRAPQAVGSGANGDGPPGTR